MAACLPQDAHVFVLVFGSLRPIVWIVIKVVLASAQLLLGSRASVLMELHAIDTLGGRPTIEESKLISRGRSCLFERQLNCVVVLVLRASA